MRKTIFEMIHKTGEDTCMAVEIDDRTVMGKKHELLKKLAACDLNRIVDDIFRDTDEETGIGTIRIVAA